MIDFEDFEETLDELGISQGQRISTLADALKDASSEADEEEED